MPSTPRTKPQAQADAEKQALALYKASWGEASKGHAERCRKYDAAERAYKAELKKGDSLGYKHDLRPAYCYETIDILVSAIMDDEAKVVVKPKQSQFVAGAKLHEKILEQQRERDDRTSKLTEFVLNGFVFNMAVAKDAWDYRVQDIPNRSWQMSIETGRMEEQPSTPTPVVVCDQPTFTVIDPRKFLPDPHARTIDECAYVLLWFDVTKQSLVDANDAAIAAGADPIYSNLDEIEDQKGDPSGKTGRLKLVERWTRDRLITVVNDQTVIRDEANPSKHGHIPVVVAQPITPLGAMVKSFSMADIIAPLQRALWESINQRSDMGEIVLNPPIWWDPNMVEEKSLIGWSRPGAKIPRSIGTPEWGVVENLPVSVLAAAIENEAPLKGDLRDIPGAVAYLSGAGEQPMDQKTATGIAAIQSMAQLRLKKMRRPFAVAARRAGMLELASNKQLLRAADVIRIDTRDGWEWQGYTIQDIQGDYDVLVTDEDENVNQQQRRSDAILELQTLAQVIPLCAQFPALIPAVESFLDAMDYDTPEEIIGPLKQMVLQAQQQQALEQTLAMQQQVPPNGAAPGGPPAPGASAAPGPTTPVGAGSARPAPPRPGAPPARGFAPRPGLRPVG